MGGTELMMKRLVESFDPEYLEKYQIIASRVNEELNASKIRILWLHDLPEDPASRHLANGGWKKFHKLVFVSNWQMQRYIDFYKIPWEHCCVMMNAIDIDERHIIKPTGVINLAYWSTPHRGLDILVPVFQKLCETHKNIKLHVFSSFELYGWGERDKDYQALFDQCKNDPNIEYYGTVSNKEINERIKDMHILAYPNTWVETSCLVLMEAMAAGMICVHPNYGALYETAANLTEMYHWESDKITHANKFYHILDSVINSFNNEDDRITSLTHVSRFYANSYYNWKPRALQWKALLESLSGLNTNIESDDKEYFTYSV